MGPKARKPKQDVLGLSREGDVKLRKEVVNGQFLRHDGDWVTNGLWTLRKTRLAAHSFLTCPECLKSITGGQSSMMDLPKDGVQHLLRNHVKVLKFTRTKEAELLDEGDFVRFREEDGRGTFLLSRTLVDTFELSEVWAPDSKGPAFDAEEAGDVSLILEVFRGGEDGD